MSVFFVKGAHGNGTEELCGLSFFALQPWACVVRVGIPHLHPPQRVFIGRASFVGSEVCVCVCVCF